MQLILMAKAPKNPWRIPLVNPSLFTQFVAASPFSSPNTNFRNRPSSSSQLPLILLLSVFILCTFFAICAFTFYPISQHSILCSAVSPSSSLASLSLIFSDLAKQDGPSSAMVPLPAHGVPANPNLSLVERDFWRQPDDEGYRPCLGFGLDYRKMSGKISKEKRKFLVVVVSGGLNQQRRQIVDAVVMARILEAALVVPVFEVHRVWGDESEFADIFDLEHFRKTLQADVRIVSSLPATHLVSRQSVVDQIPYQVSPMWLRARFLHQLNNEGLLILKGLESRLSKNLPSDLQKLRCKVAFHALRFTSPINELGNKIARRMWIEGPYIAVHLRIEKDAWVKTGCLTGLGPEHDEIITKERESKPDLLTDNLNLSNSARHLSGLCPLSALEVARLLKGLGAPGDARIYLAGGKPFGGNRALESLVHEFPNIFTKQSLAREGELTPYMNKPSFLAAIDYIVSLSSDVFVPSHGGNMAKTIQGHRAFVGHRKYIKPNKRMMVMLLENVSLTEEEFGRTMRRLHKYSLGQPEPRNESTSSALLRPPRAADLANVGVDGLGFVRPETSQTSTYRHHLVRDICLPPLSPPRFAIRPPPLSLSTV
ncbi:O-fucosyltransferase family protein [Striga hermonthica]|uniref:O-fucosyltransferase family protein n=1 Tax=Striga hermonthica TaxID=68872 RepID=A0A9N7R0N0_STRHE|nr:O-fucosyltransferase family protein [Striga hermonthica]